MRYFLASALILLLFRIGATGQEELLSSGFYEVLNTSDDVLLLDVRTKQKFLEERIAGAVYAGEKSVLLREIERVENDTKILVYCDYGKRSASVLKILKKKGFSNIFHLDEGFIKWKEKGFPVDDTKN